MNRFPRRPFAFGGTLATLGLLTLVGGGLVAAQNATPAATAPHPIHIHAGSCANLDPAPAFVLTDVAAPAGDAQYAGSGAPVAVEVSETVVDIALADLVSGDYAINAHESADAIENYIACGDIGGVIWSGAGEGNQLVIGLQELNDSGESGVAILRDAGAQTAVTVFLAADLSAGATAAATAASHEGHDAASEAIEVSIQDFAYNPDPITVAVGDSVTWTNLDAVPHTATASDRDVLQTASLAADASATVTFATAGTYEYFCEFHPNMHGTIVVE